MNFEAFILMYLHERSRSVQQISEYFAKDVSECQNALDALLEDSFVYKPDGILYRSTPAGMAFVKSELEKNEVKSLKNSIEAGMKYPMYVMSMSKDKKKVMGIYDRRGLNTDVYPVLPDAMCESGYAGAILKSHVYASFLFLKLYTVTRNGKGTFFKLESECVSAEIAKKELEFLMLTLDTIMCRLDIKSYVAELVDRRCSLPSVTEGAHIALNEIYVLENHFGDANFSQKTLDCVARLLEQCKKIKEILVKGKGYQKIQKILSVDISELC